MSGGFYLRLGCEGVSNKSELKMKGDSQWKSQGRAFRQRVSKCKLQRSSRPVGLEGSEGGEALT